MRAQEYPEVSLFRNAGAVEKDDSVVSQGLLQLGLGTYQIGVGVKKGRRGRGRRRGGLTILKVQGACVWVGLCVCVGEWVGLCGLVGLCGCW